MSEYNLLKNIYIFKGLSSNQLEKVFEICETEKYASGDDIFVEKDKATALYVIKYGSVRVHMKSVDGDNIEVSNLGTGSHFGEMALLDGEPRSASVTAIEKTDVVRIEFAKFQEILDENVDIAVHVYRSLAKFLCGRLRITTNDLGFAREKNFSHF